MLGAPSSGCKLAQGWPILASGHERRRELDTLIRSDAHPAVLRCFAMEEDSNFVYIALERCECTLAALARSLGVHSAVRSIVGAWREAAPAGAGK